jgi:hypothetical protein
MPRPLNLPEQLSPEDIADVRTQAAKTGTQVTVGGPSKPAGKPKGGLALPPPPPPGVPGGTGIKPYTPGELKALKERERQALQAKLTGPFTPEAILSGYASQVAQLYGVNHPSAEAFARHGMATKMSQTAFGQWLRSRPEFFDTEIGRKMRADALTVLAQTFGYVT